MYWCEHTYTWVRLCWKMQSWVSPMLYRVLCLKSRLPLDPRRSLIFTIHLQIRTQCRYMPAPFGMIKAGAVEPMLLKANISARDAAAGVGAGENISLLTCTTFSGSFSNVKCCSALTEQQYKYTFSFKFSFFYSLTHPPANILSSRVWLREGLYTFPSLRRDSP